MTEWNNLKEDLYLYFSMVGNQTPPTLLKLVDFVDDLLAGRDPSGEMSATSLAVLVTIADAVHETGGSDRLGKCLQWARDHDRPAVARSALRADLDAALQELKAPTPSRPA